MLFTVGLTTWFRTRKKKDQRGKIEMGSRTRGADSDLFKIKKGRGIGANNLQAFFVDNSSLDRAILKTHSRSV